MEANQNSNSSCNHNSCSLKRRIERLYRLYSTHWDYVSKHLDKITTSYINKQSNGECDLHFSFDSIYGKADIILGKNLVCYDGTTRHFCYCCDNNNGDEVNVNTNANASIDVVTNSINSVEGEGYRYILNSLEESALREFERYSFSVFSKPKHNHMHNTEHAYNYSGGVCSVHNLLNKKSFKWMIFFEYTCQKLMSWCKMFSKSMKNK